VLHHVERLRPKELLLVVHGSDDRTLEMVLSRTSRSMTTFVYPFPLGPDVWRAIGAREATGDVLLFLGTDAVIPSAKLIPLVQACYRGVDIAAGRRVPPRHHGTGIGRTATMALAQACLNSLLAQPRGTSALIDLPFAIRRESVGRIGAEHLLVPPLAYAIAVAHGLKVEQFSRMNKKSRTSRPRVRNREREDAEPMRAELRLGDYLEALQYVAIHAEEGS
jgi:glycosyltransferase involved in cell wall biosynthesis